MDISSRAELLPLWPETKSRKGTTSQFCQKGDLAVHGGGRVPEIDDLGLEEAGVKRQKRGVEWYEPCEVLH